MLELKQKKKEKSTRDVKIPCTFAQIIIYDLINKRPFTKIGL